MEETRLYNALLCLLALLGHSQATTKTIKLGALVDKLDMEQERAYEFAERSINRNAYLRLTHIELKMKHTRDSFETSNKVCSLSRETGDLDKASGVAVVFGPLDISSSDYVRSFSLTFRIPQIQLHPQFSPLTERELKDSVTLNFWPQVDEVALAYKDLAEKFEWKRMIILTTGSTDYLPFLKYLLEYHPKRDVIIRQVTPDRAAVEILRQYSDYKNILVDMELEECKQFMSAAYEMEMLSGYYHYHFTSLDISTLSDDIGFMSTGAVNVTSFSLVKHVDSTEFDDMKRTWGDIYNGNMKDFKLMMKTRNALIYDSLKYTSLILSKFNELTPGLTTERMHCDGGRQRNKWQFGDALYNHLVSNSTQAVTGNLQFDSYGRRTNFSLSLLEFDVDGKVQQVGYWSKAAGLNITKSFDKVKEDVSKDFERVTFKIAVKLEEPFVMKREYDEEGRLIPDNRKNERYTGFCIEMMREIAAIVNMSNYEFYEVSEGSKEKADGTWTGIIGGLMTGKYDLGISPITVTEDRSLRVDFTINYMDLGISILFKKPPEATPGLFSFMLPFDVTLWIAILAALVATSFVLFLIARFSPGQWDNPHPCAPDVQLLENDLTPFNSFWFTIGSFLQQGTEIMPKSGPTRIVASVWWLFCLICVSSYTANLAAYLTKSKLQLKINSADDLAKQNVINYGCYASGSTREFFRKSKIPTFAKINNYMLETNGQYNVNSTAEGVQRVIEGNYAYIMESIPLRYELATNCELIEIGKELNQQMYSVALPKDSPYTRDISSAILRLKENQKILNLYNKWWMVNDSKCNKEKVVSVIESSKLGLANFAGVFLILFAMLALAGVILIIEFIVGAYRDKVEKKTTFCEEFWNNVKFSANCCKYDEKPRNVQAVSTEEMDDDYLERPLDSLSLSIGSLNTATLATMSDRQTTQSRSHPASRYDNRSRNSSGLPRRPSISGSTNSLDITKETATTTGSQRSLVTVRDNRPGAQALHAF